MEAAMAMGRPKKPMALTAGQRDELEAMERSQSLRRELVSRARVILLCATGKTNHEVGELMMMNGATGIVPTTSLPIGCGGSAVTGSIGAAAVVSTKIATHNKVRMPVR